MPSVRRNTFMGVVGEFFFVHCLVFIRHVADGSGRSFLAFLVVAQLHGCVGPIVTRALILRLLLVRYLVLGHHHQHRRGLCLVLSGRGLK